MSDLPARNNDPIILLEKVNKWFGDLHVLQDIDLTVGRKERIVVCGPSGSGKSTMIRCINRLEEHQQGTIIVDGIELTGNLKNIDSVRREVGMVFQQFNLFPHLTVKENVTLAPIWVKKMSKKEAQELAMHTCNGASKLLIDSGNHPEEEIDRVTTPKGCTIEGLNEMEHKGLSSSLIQGMVASFNKINVIKTDQK